jgi:hypothetical protein
MYFKFYCNTSSGQVSFMAPKGPYRVTSIDPSARTFVSYVKYDKISGGTRTLNLSLPFNEGEWSITHSDTDSVIVEAEVKISWAPPQEPSCTSSRDCKDWPNSTCNVAIDGKRRCLCTGNFLWHGSNLN